MGSGSTNRISTLLNETRIRSQRLNEIMHDARLANLRKALTQMVEKIKRLLDESRSNRTIMNYLNREIHRLPTLITLAVHLTDNLLEQHGTTRSRLELPTATTTSRTPPSSTNNEPVWTVTTGTNTSVTPDPPTATVASASAESATATSFGYFFFLSFFNSADDFFINFNKNFKIPASVGASHQDGLRALGEIFQRDRTAPFRLTQSVSTASTSRESSNSTTASTSNNNNNNDLENNDNSMASNENALSAEIQSIIERIQNNSTSGGDSSRRYQNRSGINSLFDNDSDEREDDDEDDEMPGL